MGLAHAEPAVQVDPLRRAGTLLPAEKFGEEPATGGAALGRARREGLELLDRLCLRGLGRIRAVRVERHLPEAFGRGETGQQFIGRDAWIALHEVFDLSAHVTGPPDRFRIARRGGRAPGPVLR